MIKYIERPETDPYYNLAAEEYLFEKAVADTFMSWQNEPSVIIGKHQNTLKEINSSYINRHNIPVIRRITGGGTVYHDPGNINFSFIFTGRKDNLIDFREFTRPVILFLESLGLNARFAGKNNITVNGLKVSGNAAHLYKNKVLYHGTLLFETRLEFLEKAIAGNESLFHDKAVSSVRAKTINIKDILKDKLSTEAFISQFRNFIFDYFGGITEAIVNEEDKLAIRKLVVEKYRTFQWNYGYSPDYEFHNEWVSGNDLFQIDLDVREGIIRTISIKGPDAELISKAAESFVGLHHHKKSVGAFLENLKNPESIDMNLLEKVVDHLF